MPSAAAQARLWALGQQLREFNARGDHRNALQAARQALALAPGHAKVLCDIGLCHMRLGELDRAYEAYTQAVKAAPQAENTIDGLAECCGHMGRHDEAGLHGRRALDLKAAQVAGAAGWPLPQTPPPAFSPAQPQRNVVAFSLFGANPRYCETAVLNAQRVPVVLPGFSSRFYLDASVPAGLQDRLVRAGAQVVDMSTQAGRDASPLMWRFLVLDDAGVDRFLLRDADSLVSAREAAAVQQWLQGPQWFHLMRDQSSHSELLLAGMWGGCGGVFRDVAASLVAYTRLPPKLGARLVDQHWLRAHAWPTVRQSLMQHDSAFAWNGALPFPPHAPVDDQGPDFHVGANIADVRVGADSAKADGDLVQWAVVDETGAEICRYASPCRGGKWQGQLPRPYADALLQGRWKCRVLP